MKDRKVLKQLSTLIPTKVKQWYIDNTVPGRGWTYDNAIVNGVNNTSEAVEAMLHNDLSTVDNLVLEALRRLLDPNLDSWERNNLLSYLSHLDGLSIYLNRPQRSNLFIPAKDSPTIGTLDNGKHLILMDTPEEKEYLVKVENDAKRNGKTSQWYINPYFRNVKASIGTDPSRGEYVSYYKRYDYGDKEGTTDSEIDKYTGGTPFDVYGRVYLDDYYGVNSAPDKKDYYGGYLPEITVYPKETLKLDLIPPPSLPVKKNPSPFKLPNTDDKLNKLLWINNFNSKNGTFAERLNNIAQANNMNLQKDPFQEDLSWFTEDMWKNMSGDEILKEAQKRGFKSGGKLNYLNLFK